MPNSGYGSVRVDVLTLAVALWFSFSAAVKRSVSLTD